jgi:magnesium transporter
MTDLGKQDTQTIYQSLDARTEALLGSPEALEDFALGDDYALNPAFITLVIDAADRGNLARLAKLIKALHPADMADLLGFLSEDYREILMPLIAIEDLPEVLTELDEDIREELIKTLPTKDLALVLSELDSDDATAVFEDLELDQQQALLAALPESEAEAMKTSLRFEPYTAGRLMQREVMNAPPFWTVGQCIDHMRENADNLPELFFDIYITDPAHKVLGGLAVSTLMRFARSTDLSTLMEPVTEISAHLEQEEVAYIFEKYHLISAPVVDETGRLIGQITVDDIVNIIQEENREDILALGGVSDDEGRDSSVLDGVRSRLPWLSFNLITAFVSVSVISAFAHQIAQLVILAVLMPVVASLGGNSGTQALTVSVRALAARELSMANAARTVLREVKVALVNAIGIGLLLAIVAAGLYFYTSPSEIPVQDAVKLGGVMLLSVLINFTAAALAGTLVPLTLSHLDRDPAVASPIFVTMITDSIGFFSFLALASLILL